MKKYTFFVLTMSFLVGMFINTSSFAVTHTVTVQNFNFNPSSLNVEVGDILKWVWVEGSHTTTSTSVPAGAASWDSPLNSGNQTFSYTVTTAGNYDYHCTLHAGMGMVGSFVATAAAPTLLVTPSNQNVSSMAGSTSFTVLSNANWTASGDVTWCTVTNSGSGNGTIMATYDANSSNTERTANITVSVSGLSPMVVTVIQDGSSVGIPETSANFIRLFPNPAKDVVKISLDNVSSDNARISLIDLTGKILLIQPVSGNETSLNVGNLPRGLYFVKILLNNEPVTRRLILVD